VPGMVHNWRSESFRARYKRSRREAEGQLRRREAGWEGSPTRKYGQTDRPNRKATAEGPNRIQEKYRQEGTPQGGPLSPLLANLLLDVFDKELEKRGHSFVRYADDCSIYVRSKRAGRRVMASVTRFLEKKLKLKVNESKSKVARPRNCSLLGFSIGKAGRAFVSDKSIQRFKHRIRELTNRTRGRRIEKVICETAEYIKGWLNYFGYAYSKQRFRELSSWINRRLRCYLWKQWGRRGYRELRKRGVSRKLAWNTSKSAHCPWRLSRSPAMSIALPSSYFETLGLPSLHVNV